MFSQTHWNFCCNFTYLTVLVKIRVTSEIRLKCKWRLHRNWTRKHCYSRHAGSKICWHYFKKNGSERGGETRPLLLFWTEKAQTTHSQKHVHEIWICSGVYYSTEHFIPYSRATPRKSWNLSQDAPHRPPLSFHSLFLLFTGSTWRDDTSHQTCQVSLILSMFS